MKATFAPTVPQEPQLPAEALQRVEAYFEAKRSSRYMEQNCEPTTYPRWEGLPRQKCTCKAKRHDKLAKVGLEKC